MVRDRDIWFSVRDEIETETFPRFHETETRQTVRGGLRDIQHALHCRSTYTSGQKHVARESVTSCIVYGVAVDPKKPVLDLLVSWDRRDD